MLDGALFIVKCTRYGNPGKNVCSDFFFMPKRFGEFNLQMQSNSN